ncbi:50S ribosomal protein L18, chloroplastic-like [Zingiber officinale]|uniref:50S ribosomal protein L18, chloroplastic-like n=1 Tax=Zingiber officinale TaxID=94328 RepID=UPI001C4D9CC8|nr:50S ribosomal protein L18, chloroplastic-like [Zingiber officinale]
MLLSSSPAAAAALSFPAMTGRSTFLGGQLLFFQPNKNPFTSTLPATAISIVAKVTTRRENRTARHERIRKKVNGTSERPRMCIYRSNKHLYVQVIDDSKMHTLASASTMQKPISEEHDYSSGPTLEVAKKVGEVIAKACLEKGIAKVAFDRGGYPYHGRIEALANAAREHGLEF